MIYYAIILSLCTLPLTIRSTNCMDQIERFKTLKNRMLEDIRINKNDFVKKINEITQKNIILSLGNESLGEGILFIRGKKATHYYNSNVKDILWNLGRQALENCYKTSIEKKPYKAFIAFCEDDREFEFIIDLRKSESEEIK